jgi:hypothetical protein
VTAPSLELTSSAGSVTLANANNSIASLAAATNGATSIRTSGALNVTAGGIAGVNSNGNAITLQSGGAMTLGQSVTATGSSVTLNAGGGISQTGGALTASALELLGSGTQTLNMIANNVGTLAGNVSGSIIYKDADTLDIGATVSTFGVNTHGNGLRLSATGITQSQAINTGSLDLYVRNAGAVNLSHAGNSIGTLAAATSGAFTLVNTAGSLYITTLTNPDGPTGGVNTNGNNFTLTTNNLWLGSNNTDFGGINVGGRHRRPDHRPDPAIQQRRHHRRQACGAQQQLRRPLGHAQQHQHPRAGIDRRQLRLPEQQGAEHRHREWRCRADHGQRPREA